MSMGAEEFYVQLEGPATLADYHQLMDDRPVKFTPEQVGYTPRPKFKETCDACVHWFKSPAAKRAVCEIMRPRSESESVAPYGWCRFWTEDYRNFPLLDKETSQ